MEQQHVVMAEDIFPFPAREELDEWYVLFWNIEFVSCKLFFKFVSLFLIGQKKRYTVYLFKILNLNMISPIIVYLFIKR